jgi:hypothetical protein
MRNSLPGKLVQSWLCSLGVLALAGGPAVSAAQAKSIEGHARKDTAPRKRVARIPTQAQGRAKPAAQNSNTSKKDDSNSGRPGFVAVSAAKPADTDSSQLNDCLAAASDLLPRAALLPTYDAPRPVPAFSSPHRAAYYAQAPPTSF